MTEPTEYTPTIEQFLGFANSALIASGMPEEEAFQITERVLAAHDAEVRASAMSEAARIARSYDTGYDTTAATIAEALADSVGVVAEEPEWWEYSYVFTEPGTGDFYDRGWPFGTFEEALSEGLSRLAEYDDDLPTLVVQVNRRRKAGLWVQVEQGDDDA